MSTQTYTNTVEIIECGECGVTFGLTEEYLKQRRKDHVTWYCPNGHKRYYNADKETCQQHYNEVRKGRR